MVLQCWSEGLFWYCKMFLEHFLPSLPSQEKKEHRELRGERDGRQHTTKVPGLTRCVSWSGALTLRSPGCPLCGFHNGLGVRKAAPFIALQASTRVLNQMWMSICFHSCTNSMVTYQLSVCCINFHWHFLCISCWSVSLNTQLRS